jgi:chromosome partitioning protein
MATIAVFNRKDGVGTTTTALNLLAGIAQDGARPLGLDLDPRAQLSFAFGVRPADAADSLYGFFAHRRPLSDVAVISKSGVPICPAHEQLAGLDALLGKGTDAVTRLRRALRGAERPEGAAVIDCPSHFGILSLNALFACDVLLVPVSADFLGLQAAQEVDRVLGALEPVLRRRLPRRYVLTRCDDHSRMSVDVAVGMAASLRATEICETRIREGAELAQSPGSSRDVFRHAPESRGARDYRALVEELARAGFLDR